jgi:RHS repeat-associated protein
VDIREPRLLVGWQLPVRNAKLPTPTVPYNLRYPGQYFDSETGLFQNVFRDYDPLTGKYIESDPIGLRGGTNTYAYAYDIPIRFVDPQGLAIWICSRAVNGFPFVGNHGYLWNDQTRKSCGKRGSSGLGPLGEGEKGPDGGDSCTKVPGSDGLEDQVMSCCTKTANLAPWLPVAVTVTVSQGTASRARD